MSNPVWGMLAKSQIDPEKIEEAIARMIQEHNENEEAHLGPGQSLQSHKAAEIIDHLASSIVSDKIKDFEILRSKLRHDAVAFVTRDFDKGIVIDFSNFSSYVSGSATIQKKTRLAYVRTGATQNSVAKIYSELPQSGNFWTCGCDLELAFHFYIAEYWGWETAPGAAVYIKYGLNTDPGMGGSGDKSFGIKIEDQSNGSYKVTGFVRSLTELKTLVLATNLQATIDYVVSIKKVGSVWTFYLDDAEIDSITNELEGTATPYLTIAAHNPVSGSEAELVLNSVGYHFPYF